MKINSIEIRLLLHQNHKEVQKIYYSFAEESAVLPLVSESLKIVNYDPPKELPKRIRVNDLDQEVSEGKIGDQEH